MKKYVLIAMLLSCADVAFSDVRLPKILSDHMVLQRNKPIVIWGWADPKEKVTVSFKSQVKKITTDNTGHWKITLSPEDAGGPFQLFIKGKNIITLNDILIGEVWVCSGQSNMEWTVKNSNHAQAEITAANFPQIRQFLVEKFVSVKLEEDVKSGDWKSCSPETVGDFTAVGYFFARDLYNDLKVPIGLINTSWGGTHSETWTSREAFEQNPEFKEMISSMPSLDLDKIAQQKKMAQEKKLLDMNIVLPAKNVDQWKMSAFDDSQWKSMQLPALWEEKVLPDFDGIVWYRKSVTIGSGDADKDAVLELGTIDDEDETYVNGISVGSTHAYNEKRKYKISAGTLKEGKNIIAVKVTDTGGGGGMYGEAADMKLTTATGGQSLAGTWSFSVERILGSASVGPNSYPTLLFNGMINPLLNVGIAGAIWYQGESNAGRAYQYRTAFPLMIQDWRKHWKQGDFPFYFVQLASFDAENGDSQHGSTWAELREAQTMTLSLPNTGMAVTTDIGEAKDIHPRNKQDVGKRLAAVALAKTYGRQLISSGPSYRSMKVEGNKVRLTFDNLGSGLMIKDKYGYLKGFEVAGSDHKFYYAKAWIEGSEVVVSSDQVAAPVAVHFAWADNPEDANLFNKEGFPAVPFRTDDWPGITVNAKFSFE